MMQEPEIASRYCENLGQSVILCRQEPTEADRSPQYRCLSAHLCGKTDCTHDLSENQAPRTSD
ncbi:MAG: hypothetical protein ACI3XM_02780 [Eubacteriales bacterium]